MQKKTHQNIKNAVPFGTAFALLKLNLSADGVDDVAPIHVAALEAVNKHLGGGDVGGDGNVVNVAKAQKICVVGLKIALGQRVAEKEQKIDFVAADAGGNLLVSPLRAA